MHVYRWDLDRTYLDTAIHTVRGLIKTAFEEASEKRTLPGAAALLRALVAADPKDQVCMLSGSPRQMREVLLEKLALDGVRPDRLILKDNLRNIKRGRLKAVTGQIGYKLPALLEERVSLEPSVHETLFGDDSEADALIYTAYAMSVRGELSASGLARVLEQGKAYPDAIERAVKAYRLITQSPAVDDIFIRLDRRTPVSHFRLLGGGITPIFSWLQAAVVLHERGRLPLTGVVAVTRTCAEEADLSIQSIAGLLQDAARRQLVRQEVIAEIVQAPGMEAVEHPTKRLLAQLPSSPSSTPSQPTDFATFLRTTRNNHS